MSSLAILLAFAVFAGTPLFKFGLLALLFEGLLLLSILLESRVLRGQPLATFHRLTGLSVASNCVWLSLSYVGLLGYFVSSSPQRYIFMMVVGIFAAITLRGVAFRALFLNKFLHAIPLAFLQPTLMALPILFSGDIHLGYSEMAPSYIVGTATTSLVLLYVFQLGRVGGKFLPDNPLKIFRAFMLAWAVDKPDELEDYFEKLSKPTSVKTYRLEMENDHIKSVLIQPEIHPGPLSKLGSSNLPYDLYQHYRDSFTIPMVLHGISNHDLNLPSRKEVERFLLSLNSSKSVSASNSICKPVRVSTGRSTATCLAIEDSAIIMFTLAPYGMEDFPESVREEVTRLSSEMGFRHILAVDCHNGLGKPPTDEDCKNAIQAAAQALKFAKNSQRFEFMVGAAHSSEINAKFGLDLGPAGLSILLIEIEDEKYILIGADANNARLGLREEIENYLRSKGVALLEFCTSDTHYLAGKAMNNKGYYAFGEVTKNETILQAVEGILHLASTRLRPSNAKLYLCETIAKTVGPKTWVDFSSALDGTFSYGKKAGAIIFPLILLIAIIGSLS